MNKMVSLIVGLGVGLMTVLPACGQENGGTVERITVFSVALEGNLSGDSPDREVSIYLPPSYRAAESRRYPVVYMLHGFTDNDGQWFGVVDHWINLPQTLDEAYANGSPGEVIVVMPNAYTRFQGSMYSTSVTIGDWETFISEELVAFIDNHYRTIPQATSRGLAGHSMGGYGTIRLGMKYPDVFSSIYMLSPCCMVPNILDNPDALRSIEAVQTVEDLESQSFFTMATLASAAAWAPNPTKPPFYLDLPSEEGNLMQEVLAKFAANAPLVVIDQYIPNLKKLNAIAFDAGIQDRGIAATIQTLDQKLNNYGIPHAFEIYEGDHLNRIAERIEKKVLPFFTTHLVFE